MIHTDFNFYIKHNHENSGICFTINLRNNVISSNKNPNFFFPIGSNELIHQLHICSKLIQDLSSEKIQALSINSSINDIDFKYTNLSESNQNIKDFLFDNKIKLDNKIFPINCIKNNESKWVNKIQEISKEYNEKIISRSKVVDYMMKFLQEEISRSIEIPIYIGKIDYSKDHVTLRDLLDRNR